MKVNDKIVAAVIIAIGIIGMGYALRSGIIQFKDMDRSVTVKGLSEREVKADKVTWSLTYKELGNDPTEMYNLLEQKNGKVVAFLKTSGIKTENISINPPQIVDRQADNYGNEIMNYRYKATSVITVTSNEVEKVRSLLSKQSELMKQGIALVSNEYDNNNVVYEFTGLNTVKPEMIEEATKNARVTAQKFADDSGSKLGEIRSAQQGQFSIEDRDVNTPFIKKLRVVNTIEYSLK
ncbi:MAG: SIMPL domain-containing protein [Prevotellaceae bacterium]|nr:SIMPL domain-containing protein [Candidatus Colivivens equi]MCQ2077193.1 SIMPL domain-containing protein [Bacteroidaceae bacterium]